MIEQDILIRNLKVIGRPFVYGGRDLDGFDCYGILKYLYKELQGIDLPDYVTPDGNNAIALMMSDRLHNHWCEDPKGNLIFMRLRSVAHVGYDLRDGRFIHAWQNSGGVCIERTEEWKNKIIKRYSPSPAR